MKWNTRPLVLAALGILLTATNAMAAMPPTGSATRTLQFTSGGHVLGFTPKEVMVATGSHALRIEFIGAQGVEPIADGSAATDSKAAPLTRVTYPGIWYQWLFDKNQKLKWAFPLVPTIWLTH